MSRALSPKIPDAQASWVEKGMILAPAQCECKRNPWVACARDWSRNSVSLKAMVKE
jgi:hypothetical protein